MRLELLQRVRSAVLVAQPKWEATRAGTIQAPAAAVWPWLMQLGAITGSGTQGEGSRR
jgi:hypothetical protein